MLSPYALLSSSDCHPSPVGTLSTAKAGTGSLASKCKKCMANTYTTPTARKQTALRTVALPAEHGSWGLTLEPILLGLLVAPSWGGVALTVGAFAAFLLRWPLKVAWTSRRQRRRERMRLALRFVALYGFLAAAGFGAALALAGWRPLWPLLLASPFGILFFAYDAQNQSRSWQAELAGPIAFSAVATGIALAGSWPFLPALGLWGVLVARAVPSILYVRARLRLDRGRPHRPALAIGAHLAALLAFVGLASLNLIHVMVAGVFVLLLLRAVWGLSRWRRPVPIKVIGFTELGWGLLTVLAVAVGTWL